jgi:hypothetical protein
MSIIAKADLEAICDSISQQRVEGLKEFDNTGVLATSFTLGASNNVTRAIGLGDAEQEEALIGPARAALDMARARQAIDGLAMPLMKGLTQHGAANGYYGLGALLVYRATRVDFNFNQMYHAAMGVYLIPAAVWPPVQTDMGVFESTGATTGTFTDGTAIDETLYSGGDLVFENTTVAMGAINGTYTFTLTKFDGTSEAKVVPAAGLAFGATLAIGVPGTDRYIDVTNITVTGSANLDQITVKSVVDRVIAL